MCSECPKFHPNWFTSSTIIAKHANKVKMHSKVFPIFGSLSQIINTKKLKLGFVTSYDIWPGNGEGLFWFRHFINFSLTYLLRHLPTYLQPWTHTGRLLREGMPGLLCQLSNVSIHEVTKHDAVIQTLPWTMSDTRTCFLYASSIIWLTAMLGVVTALHTIQPRQRPYYQ